MRTKLDKKDITQELTEAVEAYLHARANAETIRQSVDEVQQDLLTDSPLPNSTDHGPEFITDPDRTYLAEEEAVIRYFGEMDARLREAGIKPDDMDKDHCPALVAEDIQRQAELAVIVETGRMLEVDNPETLNNALLCQKDGLEKRQEFIDTAVRLIVSAGLVSKNPRA
jgi:hypothetical protein